MDEGLKALTRSDRNRCRQPRRSVAWVAHRVFWQSRGDLLDEGISGTKGGASSDLGWRERKLAGVPPGSIVGPVG